MIDPDNVDFVDWDDDGKSVKNDGEDAESVNKVHKGDDGDAVGSADDDDGDLLEGFNHGRVIDIDDPDSWYSISKESWKKMKVGGEYRAHVSIMGVPYDIRFTDFSKNDMVKGLNPDCEDYFGFCETTAKKMFISTRSRKEMEKLAVVNGFIESMKLTLRHEVIHAFLSESGLQESSLSYSFGWAKNEEMVDWIAIQAPKIFQVFKDLGCLD